MMMRLKIMLVRLSEVLDEKDVINNRVCKAGETVLMKNNGGLLAGS